VIEKNRIYPWPKKTKGVFFTRRNTLFFFLTKHVFIPSLSFSQLCGMTYSSMCDRTHGWVTRLIGVCDTTHSCVWHDSLVCNSTCLCVTWALTVNYRVGKVCVWERDRAKVCVWIKYLVFEGTWHIHVCDSYMWLHSHLYSCVCVCVCMHVCVWERDCTFACACVRVIRVM